jgi:predicted phosphodiesterase
MKIAVIADPHANFVALQAITAHIEKWKPDHVIVAGDLVNRGPRPAECLSFVLEKVDNEGWLQVRGNHEDYVISQAQPDAPRRGPVAEVHQASYWTYRQLGSDVNPLIQMPFQQSLLDPEGREVRFVHASMQGNRVGIYPETTEIDLFAKVGLLNKDHSIPPAVFCVGHTHRPLIREFKGVLVVNAGSSGLPFDGDLRPAYARLSWNKSRWSAEIVRVEYNRKQAEQDFFDSGYLEEAGPLVKLVLIEHRTARSQLYQWSVRFQEPALQGQISMDESVRKYLGE